MPKIPSLRLALACYAERVRVHYVVFCVVLFVSLSSVPLSFLFLTPFMRTHLFVRFFSALLAFCLFCASTWEMRAQRSSKAQKKSVAPKAWTAFEEFRLPERGIKIALAAASTAAKTTARNGDTVRAIVQFSGGYAGVDAPGKEGASDILALVLNRLLRQKIAALGGAAREVFLSEPVWRSNRESLSARIESPSQYFASALRELTSVLADFSTLDSARLIGVFDSAKREYKQTLALRARDEHRGVSHRALARAATVIGLGEGHRYSRRASSESFQMISLSDIRAAFNAQCSPENAVVVVAGNLTRKNLTTLLQKNFAEWRASENVFYMPRPRLQPMPLGVYRLEPTPEAPEFAPDDSLIIPPESDDDDVNFAADGAGLEMRQAKSIFARSALWESSRAAFSDSLIFLGFIADAPEAADRDYEAFHALALIVERRLRRALPECDTRRLITANAYQNIALLGVVSRNNSPANVERLWNALQNEISRACAAPPEADELRALLADESLSGGAEGALLPFSPHERRSLLAGEETWAAVEAFALAQSVGIAAKRWRETPLRLRKLKPEDLQEVAARYLRLPQISALAAAPLRSLEPLQKTRKLSRIAADGALVLPLEKSDISLSTLIERHWAALGGEAATGTIASLQTETTVQLHVMAERFPGTMLTLQKHPDKILRKLEVPATQLVQILWFDGEKAFDKIDVMGEEQRPVERTAKERESARFDAQIFPALSLEKSGFSAEILGKRDRQYLVRAISQSGVVKTLYFDERTFLLSAIEETRQTPQGILKSLQEFKEYDEYGGTLLPSTIILKTSAGLLVGKSRYQLNPQIDDSAFEPARGEK